MLNCSAAQMQQELCNVTLQTKSIDSIFSNFKLYQGASSLCLVHQCAPEHVDSTLPQGRASWVVQDSSQSVNLPPSVHHAEGFTDPPLVSLGNREILFMTRTTIMKPSVTDSSSSWLGANPVQATPVHDASHVLQALLCIRF